MTTSVLRVAKSAHGPFFVRANECLLCQLCVDAAPDLMACDDEQGEMSCYFTRQPTTPEEIESALRAMDHCCICAIDYEGDDPMIHTRIAEMQAEKKSDSSKQDMDKRYLKTHDGFGGRVRGDIEQLRALLEAGGDPNEAETEEYMPPLLEAAYENHMEAARLLLDAGADMYAPNSGGETPLLMAIQCGSLEVFRLLRERGCRIDPVKDNVPWMFTQAASHGHLEIVQWLLSQGIPVNLTDDSGCTALTRAAKRDNLAVIEELLRVGADPNHRDNDTETVLMWAADHAGNAAVLRALLKAGADVNAGSDLEGTALTWVMCHGDTEMAQVLLEAGADIDHTNALTRAAFNGLPSAVRLLLEYGANIHVTDASGQTALEVAKQRGHREVADLLQQATANRNSQERSSGST